MKVDQIRRNTYFHPLRITIAETVTAIVHSRDVFLGSEKRSGGEDLDFSEWLQKKIQSSPMRKLYTSLFMSRPTSTT